MRAITLELPNSLHKKLEELAREGGFSIEQFLTSAAAEKLSAMLDPDFLENEVKLGSQKDFEDYLTAVPDIPPSRPEDVLEN